MNGSLFRVAFSDSANQLFPDGWPTEVNRAWNELNQQPQALGSLDSVPDADLVSYANELMRRAALRLQGLDDYTYISIYAGGIGRPDKDFSITHQVRLGLSAPKELTVQGGDLFDCVERITQMNALATGTTPPVKIQPMLAPPSPPAPDYADFQEVPPEDDDVPF